MSHLHLYKVGKCQPVLERPIFATVLTFIFFEYFLNINEHFQKYDIFGNVPEISICKIINIHYVRQPSTCFCFVLFKKYNCHTVLQSFPPYLV